MSYEVFYTDNFERELKRLAKKYPSIKSDLEGLISSLEENPDSGERLLASIAIKFA